MEVQGFRTNAENVRFLPNMIGFAGVYHDVLTAGVYICIAFINQSSYHLHGQTASEKVIIDGCGLANRAVIHEWFRISPSFPLIS